MPHTEGRVIFTYIVFSISRVGLNQGSGGGAICGEILFECSDPQKIVFTFNFLIPNMNEYIFGCLESYKLSSQFLKMNYSSKACLPNLAASFCTDSAYKFEMILVVRTCFLADKSVDFSHFVSALSEK